MPDSAISDVTALIQQIGNKAVGNKDSATLRKAADLFDAIAAEQTNVNKVESDALALQTSLATPATETATTVAPAA